MKKIYLFLLLLSAAAHSRAQSLISVSPSSGERFTTLDVQITGSNTKFLAGSSTIVFFRQGSPTSDIRVNHMMPQSQTSLKANISVTGSAQNGSYPFLLATGPDMLNGIFNVGNAQLVSVTPDKISRGQSLNVTITGVNTSFVQGSTTLKFFRQGTSTTDILVNSVSVSSPTVLTASVVAQVTAEPGRIYNAVVDNKLWSAGFKVEGPEITGVSPKTAARSQTLTLDLVGSDVDFMQGNNSVQLFYQGSPTSQVAVTSVTPRSATGLEVGIQVSPGAPFGFYELRVYNSVAGKLANNTFLQVLSSPVISLVSPSSGFKGHTLNVTITGINFSAMQGSNTLMFFRSGSATSEIVVKSVTAVSSETMSASVFIKASATEAIYDLGILNEWGAYLAAEIFTVVGSDGLEEHPAGKKLDVYPNPAAGAFSFKIPPGADLISFDMYDLTGKKLPVPGAERHGDSYRVRFGDAQVPEGLYIVRVLTSAGALYSRLLIE